MSSLFPQNQNEYIKLLERPNILSCLIVHYFMYWQNIPSNLICALKTPDLKSLLSTWSYMGKLTQEITQQICDKLQTDGLKLGHCNRQRYYNAATVADLISGVQKCILDLKLKVVFGSWNHSPYFAGVHATSVEYWPLTEPSIKDFSEQDAPL